MYSESKFWNIGYNRIGTENIAHTLNADLLPNSERRPDFTDQILQTLQYDDFNRIFKLVFKLNNTPYNQKYGILSLSHNFVTGAFVAQRCRSLRMSWYVKSSSASFVEFFITDTKLLLEVLVVAKKADSCSRE